MKGVPRKLHLRCSVNGVPVEREIPAGMLLLEFLRSTLRLTGTKEGCGEGECGACTVLLDGKPVNSCLVMAAQAQGRTLTTIEGLEKGGALHPVQKAFIEQGGVQCGFCTPGMVLSSAALLEKNPAPDRQAIREGLAGNLCRCTGYERIFRAVEQAAREMAATTKKPRRGSYASR